MSTRFSRIIVLATLSWGVGVVGAGAQETSALPGGASSLRETHGDWQVICVEQDKTQAPTCAFSQIQQRKDGARVISIELAVDPAKETASGNLVLPFGLLLSAGASVQIDEGTKGEALPFTTCLPAGCIVPLTFSEEMVTALESGTSLNIQAQPIGKSEPLVFKVSLKGFQSALDRTTQLVQPK